MTQENGNAAVNALVETSTNVRQMLERIAPQLEAVLPKHITADKIIRIVVNCCSINPKLMLCTQQSLLRAVLQSAILGLQPGVPVLSEAYLIPYRNSYQAADGSWYKLMEANFQPGYKGMEKLVYNTGMVDWLEPQIVREKDKFHYELGLNPDLTHTPSGEEDRGDIVNAYCIAHPADPTMPKKFWVINKGDIARIKKSAKNLENKESPWNVHEDQMWLKSVIIQFAKRLPRAIERQEAQQDLDQAIALDGQANAELTQSLHPKLIEVLHELEAKKQIPEGAEPDDKKKTKTERMAEEMGDGEKGDEKPDEKPATTTEEKPEEKPDPELDHALLGFEEYLKEHQETIGRELFTEAQELMNKKGVTVEELNDMTVALVNSQKVKK